MKPDPVLVVQETSQAGGEMVGVANLECNRSSKKRKRVVKINKRKVKVRIRKRGNGNKRRKLEEEEEEEGLVPVVVSSILQELYDCCKDVFDGSALVPSPSHVHSLCGILGRMELEDLGLGENLVNAVNGNRRVVHTNVYMCENFSFVLFFLPESSVIPLHNHPGMTVFSRLLFGQIHHKSYDWVDSEDSKQPSGLRLARLKADVVLSAPCTNVLYPTTGGNIHEFKAKTPCVMLDVIGPPYSKVEDRDCTYYRDHPFNPSNKGTELVGQIRDDEKYGWLEEIEMPEGSRMLYISYQGPQVIENFL